MDKNSIYYKQVQLLIRMLPIIASEDCFALKGGTAINLFVRDFPRLSVDIDLAYLPLEARDEALVNVHLALERISENINQQPTINVVLQDNKQDELRIIVTSDNAMIKIEVSPVARGTLFTPEVCPVSELVEDEFGFAEMLVVSLADLYGGKLCAAMDRQHPRDLFDVKMLLDEEGISRNIFVGFLTYVLGHPRPIHEVMSPRWKDLNHVFNDEFSGMTRNKISLDQLLEARTNMVAEMKSLFTQRDKNFLFSLKKGDPDWSLFDEPSIKKLPAIQWKLMNIKRLAKNESKHKKQIELLENVLDDWLQ